MGEMGERRGGYVELHNASAFSFLRAGSSVEALVARAVAIGMSALALTDHMTLAGVVRFQTACAQAGIGGILGVELRVADALFGAGEPACVVALAENMTGYARLCQLLTEANLRDSGRSTAQTPPVIPFADLAAEPEGLIILTGGVNPAARGPLVAALLAGRRAVAEELARRYLAAFGPERLFIEVQHHLLPESVGLAQALSELAEQVGARLALTNGARYATRDDYPLYDLLTCVRLGLTVDQSHRERPRNDAEALVAGEDLLARLAMFPWARAARAARAASGEIADRCLRGDVGLLRPACVAPRVPLPEGMTPRARLEQLCAQGLTERYQHAPEALAMESAQRLQLAHELEVICGLELEEFFLCVHDIVSAARRLGIRVSGRGSAANSLVAYLLGITGVDPIAHGLLFARFLTPERRGMPDIDIDVQSDRREELIRYVERTYSERHAAMVANVITYRPRSALRDVAKALGYPLPLVNRLTKLLHHHSGRASLLEAQAEMERAIAASAPAGRSTDETRRETLLARLPLALALAARLVGLPRHLSLHNGGMVLTREPLARTLPVRRSANGVRALEVDKDDVERLGLIKFDLLGLRTLGAVEEALALIEETTGARVPIDHLPLDDDATFRLIRAGQTLAVFQIESPGQWHLLAQTQPRTFDDLVAQTALFRPGPLQANMVYPYVQRRQAQQREGQRDAVQTPWKGPPADDFWTAHPVLGVVLRETEGILLFQEQILEIAHRFAGLSYADADGFRRAMSHARHPSEMEAMRARFVSGALAQGETEADATRVFEAVSQFVGYGFCKSHAAEFARTIYQTAWLKAHYPAHYLAAFLSCQPAGFFPPHVVLEEAKRLGIPVLPPDLNRGEDRFSVERVGAGRYARWAIRIGLRQVAQVGEDLARAILWVRRGGDAGGGDAGGGEHPFTSLEDAIGRLRPQGLTWAAAEALVMCGALDGLEPRMERRRRLWRLHEVWPLLAPAKSSGRSSGRSSGKRRTGEDSQRQAKLPRQLALDWAQALATPDPAAPPVAAAPSLPALDAEARSALDYALLGMSPRPHPMRARRRELQRRGVQTIAELVEAPEGRLTRVAGWAISAQRPPTAHGMGFLVLEDETGRLPVALPPKLAERLHALARGGYPLVVAGRVERVRWYRSMFATAVAPCPA